MRPTLVPAASDKQDSNMQCSEHKGRPHDSAKRAAIVEAAGELFIERGFDRVSMDEIAREAKVSKQTVYSHFGGKEGLFRSVIASAIDSYAPVHELDHAQELPIAEALFTIGRQFLNLILSENAVGMERCLINAAQQDSKMGRLFFDAGPRPMIERMSSYLADAVIEGKIVIDDPEKAAWHFCSLLKGQVHLRRALGLIEEIDNDKLDAHTRECVDVFLRIYR